MIYLDNTYRNISGQKKHLYKLMQESHLNKKTKIVVNRLLKLFHRKAANEILGEARQSLVQQFNFRFFLFFLFTFSDDPPRCPALKILLW